MAEPRLLQGQKALQWSAKGLYRVKKARYRPAGRSPGVSGRLYGSREIAVGSKATSGGRAKTVTGARARVIAGRKVGGGPEKYLWLSGKGRYRFIPG